MIRATNFAAVIKEAKFIRKAGGSLVAIVSRSRSIVLNLSNFTQPQISPKCSITYWTCSVLFTILSKENEANRSMRTVATKAIVLLPQPPPNFAVTTQAGAHTAGRTSKGGCRSQPQNYTTFVLNLRVSPREPQSKKPKNLRLWISTSLPLPTSTPPCSWPISCWILQKTDD